MYDDYSTFALISRECWGQIELTVISRGKVNEYTTHTIAELLIVDQTQSLSLFEHIRDDVDNHVIDDTVIRVDVQRLDD